jgi:hypothetical protein
MADTTLIQRLDTAIAGPDDHGHPCLAEDINRSELADLITDAKAALLIGRAAVIMLSAIELHCQNEAGLKGQDHADDGHRVRRGIQLFLADSDTQRVLDSTPQGISDIAEAIIAVADGGKL